MKPPIKPISPAVYIEGPLIFTLPPARYPTGMEAEVMAVTRSQSARLKLEMVVPAEGALSITGYLGSSKRIPIAPSFLRRCRQKEIGNALSVPPVTIVLPSHKCNAKGREIYSSLHTRVIRR